jgi:hypothetical protein
LNSEVERLRWRRNKVLELASEGHTQNQIASTLRIALGTVNRDLMYLKMAARKNISKYIDETLPLEYQKCMIGLDAILVKTWEMANNAELERDRLQAISIAMQAYEMKLELLGSATVVDRAVRFVQKHRGVIQNKMAKYA